MSAPAFNEYVSASVSSAWRNFNEDQRGTLKIIGGTVCVSLSLILVADIVSSGGTLKGIACLALLLCFFGLFRYAAEALFYSIFTRDIKKYLRLQRELIVLSTSYEDYFTRELRSRK
jgi:hypothetical protein